MGLFYRRSSKGTRRESNHPSCRGPSHGGSLTPRITPKPAHRPPKNYSSLKEIESLVLSSVKLFNNKEPKLIVNLIDVLLLK